jgi:hypothetical protein
MSELKRSMEREAARVRAEEHAMQSVMARAARRRTARRAGGIVLALAIAGMSLGLAYAAFRPGDISRPATIPSPLPSSDVQRVAPIPADTSLFIDDRTGVRGLDARVSRILSDLFGGAIAASWLENPSPEEIAQQSQIRYAPGSEEAARQLAERFFPGAPVTAATKEIYLSEQPMDVELVLGADYTSYEPLTLRLDIVEFMESFVESRNDGSGAESFLAATATERYEEHQDGLQLYSYWPEGQTFELQGAPAVFSDGRVLVEVSARQRPPPLEDPDQDELDPDLAVIREEILLERQGDGRLLVIDAEREGSLSPSPGPTATPTSDDATPAPILMWLEDRTGVPDMHAYALEWIDTLGRGPHHGGYDVDVTLTGHPDPLPATTIHFGPDFSAEAVRMKTVVFPQAQIRPEVPPNNDPPLRAVLGEDFAELHAEAFAAFQKVEEFGNARAREAPVDSLMTDEVARYYAEDRYASLYEYAVGTVHDVRVTDARGVPRSGAGGWEFYLVFSSTVHDFNSELVRVDEVDGKLKIVEAELVMSGSG